MTEDQWEDEKLVSFLAFGTLLLRQRRPVAFWTLVGGAVGVLWALATPRTYTSQASFVPEGSDASAAAGLATLAGQFGFQLPASGQSRSPEFYVKLLKSPAVLRPIVRDSFATADHLRIAFSDLFGVAATSQAVREERSIKMLAGLVRASADRSTGVVTVSVSTKWSRDSHAIVTALLNGLNDFNLKMRRSQAGAERQFLEERLSVATADLREAEERLRRSMSSNRQIGGSAELQLQRDRLQRDVAMRQAVYTSLVQSYEQARLREVRDTPVISMLEPPSVPELPNSRGGLISLVTGLVLGAFGGAGAAYSRTVFARRQLAGDPDTAEFLSALAELKSTAVGAAARVQGVFRRS